MNLHDFSDMGNQIKDIVQDAVDKMDFDTLNHSIKQTVNNTFGYSRNENGGIDYTPKDASGRPLYKKTKPEKQYQAPKYKTNKKSSVYDVGFPVRKNPPGTVAGPLMTALGWVFFPMLCLGQLALWICNGFIPGFHYVGTPVMMGLMPLTIVSLIVALIGTSKYGKIKRFKTYLKILKGRVFCSLKELAAAIGKSTKYVAKDVQKMINQGLFPEGHIDRQKTCLMVTEDIYRQYLLAEESANRQQTTSETDNTAQQPDMSSEFRDTLETGKNYIKRIREANDAIPDTEISNKLYRMELIVSKIFDYVSSHQDQIGQLRRFLDYYMPTTIKLLNAYKEIDQNPIQGENMVRAKTEIAKTLDTINEAYEKLYDSMYVDVAMDVSSDIAVLQTLLAQEGLTGSGFDKQEEKK